DAKPSDSTSAKDKADPAGTGTYMSKLRQLFEKWDVNGDDYLDKEELAKAFRGADAKPYDFKKSKDSDKDAVKEEPTDAPKDAKDATPAKKPDSKKYPDYSF